jgi:hypothetical protein
MVVFFRNESDEQLRVSQIALRTAVRLRVTSDSGEDVSSTLAWDSAIHRAGDPTSIPVLPTDVVEVPGGGGIGWDLAVARRDGASFSGRYIVSLSSAGIAKTLAWSASPGKRVLAGELSGGGEMIVGPARSARERSEEAQIAGFEAARARNFGAAIQALERALAEGPENDLARTGLAASYVGSSRYRDAIDLYERRFPSAERDAYLAQAYLGIGDEKSAERVLRAQGLAGPRLALELARHSEEVKKRR